MTDKRRNINEAEETVNDVQLRDLYDNAVKVEQSVISLASTAMKFSNGDLKGAAQNLRDKAFHFTKMVETAMNSANLQGTIEPQEEPVDKAVPLEGGVKEGALLDEGVEGWNDASTDKESKFQKVCEALDIDPSSIRILKEFVVSKKKNNEVEETEESSATNEIDLSGPFTKVLTDISPEEFQSFKEQVAFLLSEDSNLESFSDEILNANTPEEFDNVMNNVYDAADQNSIIIKT